MILIADSGSTKCDWVLVDKMMEQPIRIKTKGLNPAILKREALQTILTNNEILVRYCDKITSVYFFGAGCNTPQSIHVVESVLSQVFKKASIVVQEDTMAAVRATTAVPAVVCILGTGSNCCFYDGKDIQLKFPAMGHLLMDEGSGNYYGKELLKSYYYNQMPHDLKVMFQSEFELDEGEVINRLYLSETPNQYLAEFAVFLFKNREHPVMFKMINEGISKFIDNQILQYREELKTVPLYFVGSIAFHAQTYIMDELATRGLKASGFVKSPIENVIESLVKELN